MGSTTLDAWSAFVTDLVAAVRTAVVVGTGEDPEERRARLEALGQQLEHARQQLESAADAPGDDVQGRLAHLVRAMEALQQDPLAHTLATAPLDDEPITPEDLAAIREAEEDLSEGRVLSTDELRRQLGLA